MQIDVSDLNDLEVLRILLCDLENLNDLDVLRFQEVGGVVKLEGGYSEKILYRVVSGDNSWIVMLLGSERHEVVCSKMSTSELDDFLSIGMFLRDVGIRVPEILGCSSNFSALLMEDIGDETLSDLVPKLNCLKRQHFYTESLKVVLKMLVASKEFMERGFPASQRMMNSEVLAKEMNSFKEYVPRVLASTFTNHEANRFQDLFRSLANKTCSDDFYFVHRDFHSKNLHIFNDSICVIDFQDACLGGVYYDAASLIYDVFVELDEEFREHCISFFIAQLRASGLFNESASSMRRTFKLQALQRLFKAAGAHARLALDAKTQHEHAFQVRCTCAAVRSIGSISNEFNELVWVRDLALRVLRSNPKLSECP
ncbi:phosphotransferase [Roseobacter weihaiensis]|uniref:phosphotransferase n=1 Tax=Roseobacter weihaiensis TaxID=2763262 RepID=UPI001D09E832|nr:phosphotransferase [Roseobacter sp. H9]